MQKKFAKILVYLSAEGSRKDWSFDSQTAMLYSRILHTFKGAFTNAQALLQILQIHS